MDLKKIRISAFFKIELQAKPNFSKKSNFPKFVSNHSRVTKLKKDIMQISQKDFYHRNLEHMYELTLFSLFPEYNH